MGKRVTSIWGPERPLRAARGFSLAEILVVLAIIAVLLSIIAVTVGPAREKARIANTRGLLKRIGTAMEEYRATHGEYPSDLTIKDANGLPEVRVPNVDPATDPADFYPGVELDRTWLTDRPPGAQFQKSDLDSTDDKYFVDAWANRIRYRKASKDRMLVWSYGQNKKDEIGVGRIWDEETKVYTDPPVKAKGKYTHMGDDLTHEEVKY